jgi:DNA primase
MTGAAKAAPVFFGFFARLIRFQVRGTESGRIPKRFARALVFISFMRFSESFLRQVRDRASLADYAGRKLAIDRRKSRPGAGDYWACCPFHQEKSASFHIRDRAGTYKCFGCSEGGDIFSLMMHLEGVSFPEAVERAAEMAGMELPQDETEDRGEAQRRKRLYAASAKAAEFFKTTLKSPAGAEARAYLQKRGLGPDVWERFGIGYAPDGWTALMDALRKDGFSLDEISAAGLAYPGEDGRRPVDVFRNRVTFEIQDPGGKVIAFGGRALDKDAKAKYLNSPETALFHKGRSLYRLKQAREILAKSKASGLVVAEGYVDVIAFERAGIAAVAPLGTALTEDQLQLVWRAGGEPTLCFDGDTAGLRAADRALDLALPHLAPEKTVKIALLPPGEDPDDVFRRAGPEALKPLIDAAKPAFEALFDREQVRVPMNTPEARAGFKHRLKEAAGRIADADTKSFYFTALLARADALLRPERKPWTPSAPQAPWTPNGQGQRGKKGKNGKFVFEPALTAELKAKSASPNHRPAAEDFLRAAVDYPEVWARFGDWVDRLDLGDSELEAIRAALQTLSAEAEADIPIDREVLSRHLHASGQERAAARLMGWSKLKAGAGPQPMGELETEWLALATREVVLPAIKEEMAALRAQADTGDEEAFARFQALSREVREIEVRAREARLDENRDDDSLQQGDLVA